MFVDWCVWITDWGTILQKRIQSWQIDHGSQCIRIPRGKTILFLLWKTLTVKSILHFHVTWCDVMTWHITSNHVIWYDVIWCYFMWFHLIWFGLLCYISIRWIGNNMDRKENSFGILENSYQENLYLLSWRIFLRTQRTSHKQSDQLPCL